MKGLVWMRAALSAAVLVTIGNAAMAKEPWEAKWDVVLAAAQKEGVVDVSGPPGAFQRRAITDAWAKAFPGIKLKYVGARGTQIVSKVVRERSSGLYNWDIILASTDPTVFSLKPINALAPLRDAIIRPDILSDRSWIGGFAAGFMDKDGKFFYSPVGTAGTLGFVNRSCVSREAFNKIDDMKKPEFVGKIAWHDPTRPGTSTQGLGVLYLSVGEAWIKDMFSNYKVIFSRDYRQMTDWLVSCARPIVMGMPNDVLEQMQKQGIGKDVEEMDGPAYAGKVNPGGIGGNASIGWYNNAPHPNAAKVFVNWYLSAEFQSYYAKIVEVNSRRTEVTPADPKHVLDPALVYFNTSEENVQLVKALQEKVKKWGVLKGLGKGK